MAVGAIQAAFDVTYPQDDAAGGIQKVYCSLDYPVRPQMIPAVWVNYEPAELRMAGIDYTETDALGNLVTRWVFQGHVSFTVVALSNDERDLICDELISMIAFAAQSEAPGPFRAYIDEGGGLLATSWSFDTIEPRGDGAAPGTPWMTDEVLYEQGLALQVRGEFVSSAVTLDLVPLREITIAATPDVPGEGAALEASAPAGGRFGL